MMTGGHAEGVSSNALTNGNAEGVSLKGTALTVALVLGCLALIHFCWRRGQAVGDVEAVLAVVELEVREVARLVVEEEAAGETRGGRAGGPNVSGAVLQSKWGAAEC
eukprot:673676-Prymnesium_polylepis.3